MNFIKGLTPLTRKVPLKIVHAFDTEDDQNGNFLFGYHYDGKRYFYFTDGYEYLEYLREISKKHGTKRVFVMATELEYDLGNAFKGYLSRFNLVYGKRLIYAHLKESNIYFVDTMNLYKVSIRAQGKILKLPKLKVDYSKMTDKKYLKVLKEYCKRDVKICYRFANKFQRILHTIGAEMKYTISASAVNVFRRYFLPKTVKKTPEDVLDTLYEAYYGGRSEIYRLEAKGRIYHYDFSSNYPSIMSSNIYPDPNTRYEGCDIKDEGVSKADVEYLRRDIYIPFLPVKTKILEKQIKTKDYKKLIEDTPFENVGDIVDNSRLLFPLGRFVGWWSNVELRYARDNGLIKIHKIYRSINYRENKNFFSGWVGYLWKLRKKYKYKNDIFSRLMNMVIKDLLNRLYGKFFEKTNIKSVVYDNGAVDTKQFKRYRYPSHSNGIWAVYTTAYARIKLYELIQEVMSFGGKPLYVDTDCIMFLLPKGKKMKLKTSRKLGGLAKEGEYKYARFFLPKTYLMVDKKNNIYITAKGIPFDKEDNSVGTLLGGVEGFKEKLFMQGQYKYRLDFLQNGKVKLRQPIKLKEANRRGGKKINVWKNQVKRMRAFDIKRIHLDNGDTKPYIFNLR